ncbi:MAG: hypothetical protein AAF432_13915 [Planctomycetota bacterium]
MLGPEDELFWLGHSVAATDWGGVSGTPSFEAAETPGRGIIYHWTDDVDCNGNGIPDWCDINDGTAFDANGNTVIDACEYSPCDADIAPPGGNGTVNSDDIVALLVQFGACDGSCDADIAPPGGNGVVNSDDLTAMILAVGQCSDE